MTFGDIMLTWYAPHGIRINAIAPSLVATPMSERAQGDAAILGSEETKKRFDAEGAVVAERQVDDRGHHREQSDQRGALRERAGQVIVARYAGTTAPTRMVKDLHLGGVVVFSENVAAGLTSTVSEDGSLRTEADPALVGRDAF